ncbi:MAG: Two-component response regulator vanRB [uncultured Sulfurovum sp.]|uniref:Two-component response regulator vanRB n=1 Tax=uncultured Sulfurovum sp. TaxID=269237 RepID=A0A6S6SLU2_9BACT|nr:MAG: Two-component response regulator vanRB [uncultured Sulfurovum sp.]
MKKEDLTILYVEDEEETRSIVSSILKKYYKEVIVAEDGQVGLAAYKASNPDIVLSDISMPNMNGLEMSAEIKALNPNQVIALFTAFNEPQYQEKSTELEIHAYILKPFDHDRFFNALHYLNMLVSV